jgi:hypothetical protein
MFRDALTALISAEGLRVGSTGAAHCIGQRVLAASSVARLQSVEW